MRKSKVSMNTSVPLVVISCLRTMSRTSFGGSIASRASAPVSWSVILQSVPSIELFTKPLPSLNHRLCLTAPSSVVMAMEKSSHPSTVFR